MKKLLLSLSVVLCVGAVSAQEIEIIEISSGLVNKRGMQILPEAGDFALGIDATPFLEYAGNMFSDGYNDAPYFGDMTIYGKYFFTNDRALRAKLTLNLNKNTYKNMVIDDAALINNSDSDATVDDVAKFGSTGVDLSVGYEWRRGYGRLQGFYGGELSLGFESYTTKYDYGNGFSEDVTSPTTTDDFNNQTSAPSDYRMTESKSGLAFGFGVGAFAGVEYFVAPKIALGGEVGLSFRMNTNPKGKTTYEYWDYTDEVVKSDEFENYSGMGNVNFSTTALTSYGKIYLLFHF